MIQLKHEEVQLTINAITVKKEADMSKRKTDINPIRAERLKKLIDEEGLTQTAFAKKMHYSQQLISGIITEKTALTERTAREIIDAHPRYRIEWLLGFDDNMTDMEVFKEGFDEKRNWVIAIDTLIDIAVKRNDCKESFNNGLNSFEDIVSLRREITDYIEFKVCRIAKEGEENGKHSGKKK